MPKFKFIESLDANGNVRPDTIEAPFTAKLIAFNMLDGAPKTYKSKSTGSDYHIAIMEYVNASDEVVTSNARVHAGNYMSKDGEVRMTTGSSYNSTVYLTKGQPVFMVMSHLQGVGFRNESSDFGADPWASVATVEAELEESRD